VRVAQLCVVLPYLIAGITKLRASGWEWADGENLRDQIMINGLYYELLTGKAPDVTFELAGWGTAFTVLAAGSLFLEVAAPLAMVRPIGYLFVPAALSMHWGIHWLMGIDFPYQLYGAAFACFVPWELLWPAWSRILAALALTRERFRVRTG
jgi:hypothetical protein